MQTKTGEMMHNITTQVGQIKWSKWATPELRTLKKQYIGLEMDQVRQMKQLQEENTRRKQLVAGLSLDKTMLQDVLRKKL
jgi:hypothetical protein